MTRRNDPDESTVRVTLASAWDIYWGGLMMRPTWRTGAWAVVSVVVIGCSGSDASPGSGVIADGGRVISGGWDAWRETGTAGLPGCAVAASARTYDLYGEPGYTPSARPSGACSSEVACTILVATGPYCADETATEDFEECECIRSQWTCVLEGISGGVVTQGWCDGGNGTTEPGGVVDAAVVPDAEPAACVVAASSFDSSCAADSDCVRATFGDYCTDPCLTAPNNWNGAINSSANASFQTAVQAAEKAASAYPPSIQSCGENPPVDGALAVCASGKCHPTFATP
jgi:hypothetical protein